MAHNGPDSAKALAAQRNRLETYAKEHDFEIVGVSNDIASGLTFENRPGLLEFYTKAVDGDVDILLLCDLARLGRDLDRNLQYWYLLCDLNVSIHTADCGEIDLNFDTRLRGMIEEMRKHPR